jgi:hypothetical protein
LFCGRKREGRVDDATDVEVGRLISENNWDVSERKFMDLQFDREVDLPSDISILNLLNGNPVPE